MITITKQKMAIILVVLLSIPVLFVLLNIANQYRKSIVAKNKVASARQSTEKSTDEKVGKAVDTLRQSGVIASDLASSKVDVCYVNHSAQGWSVTSWYQDCYIRYVNGFTTSLNKEEVRQRLSTNKEVLAHFGQEDPVSTRSSIALCSLFKKDFQTTLSYRPASPTPDQYGCTIPNPLRGTWSVKGAVILDGNLSVKPYKTFGSDILDNKQNQIWITFDEPYYHEEIGCMAGGVFCKNPRSKPAHPDLPK